MRELRARKRATKTGNMGTSSGLISRRRPFMSDRALWTAFTTIANCGRSRQDESSRASSVCKAARNSPSIDIANFRIRRQRLQRAASVRLNAPLPHNRRAIIAKESLWGMIVSCSVPPTSITFLFTELDPAGSSSPLSKDPRIIGKIHDGLKRMSGPSPRHVEPWSLSSWTH